MKRSFRTKLASVSLAALMLTATFSGCGQSGSGTGTDASANASGTADKTVTLQTIMWGEKARWDAQKEVDQAFTKKYPNIKVNLITVADGNDYWTKLQTMVAGGTPPDLAFQNEQGTPTYVAKDFMEDLTDYMAKDKTFQKDWIAANNYAPFTVNGKIYAIPTMTFSDVLFYNKTMFDNAKVPYPDDSWDWNKLRDVAKKLTVDTNKDGKIDQYGYAVNAYPNYIYSFIWANGGDIISADRKTSVLNSSQNVETFQFLHDLIWKDKVAPSPEINKDKMFSFASGKVAMYISGSWNVSTFDLNKLNYGISLSPKAPTGKRITNEYPNGWFIVKQSKNKDSAWKYLAYNASNEGQTIVAKGKVGIPTNTEIGKTDAYLKSSSTPGLDLNVTLQALALSRQVNTSSNMSEIESNIWPEFDEIWTKSDANVKSVLDDMQPKLQAELAKQP